MVHKYKITKDNLLEFYKIVLMKNRYFHSLFPKSPKNIILLSVVNKLALILKECFNIRGLLSIKESITKRGDFFTVNPHLDENNFSDYKYIIYHLSCQLNLYLSVMLDKKIEIDAVEFYINDRSDLDISF